MPAANNFRLDDFLAGWIGGASSVVVGHPLDTVKTRLQAGKGYKSLMDCVLTIYRKETVAGFFKGMSFPLVTITLYNSLVFGCFSNAQRLIGRYRHGDGRHPSSLLDLTLASTLTGLVSVGLGAPVDLVKIRLQMQMQPMVTENLALAADNVSSMSALRLRPLEVNVYHCGPLQCIGSVVQREGLGGLYRGAGAMLLRDVPGYSLYFIPYTLLCDLLSPEHTHTPQPITICLAGGLAGSISWVTATPADVVKSRMQADVQMKYRGIVHCIMHSYNTEGLQVFFRGASVNAIRGFPMSATMFLTYELSLRFFRGL